MTKSEPCPFRKCRITGNGCLGESCKPSPIKSILLDYRENPDRLIYMTAAQIAEKYGCSVSMVKRARSAHGIYYRRLPPGRKRI